MTTKEITQNDVVRKHLMEHGGITALDAEALYGIRRLAARVNDLRELYGSEAITTEKIKFVHWYTGHAGTYARYTAARQLNIGGAK